MEFNIRNSFKSSRKFNDFTGECQACVWVERLFGVQKCSVSLHAFLKRLSIYSMHRMLPLSSIVLIHSLLVSCLSVQKQIRAFEYFIGFSSEREDIIRKFIELFNVHSRHPGHGRARAMLWIFFCKIYNRLRDPLTSGVCVCEFSAAISRLWIFEILCRYSSIRDYILFCFCTASALCCVLLSSSKKHRTYWSFH